MKVTSSTVGPGSGELPSVTAAADAVRSYSAAKDSSLSTEGKQALREITRRLDRLAAQFEALMSINDQFLTMKRPKMHFDTLTDTIVIGEGESAFRLKLKRADPNVPVTLRGLTEGGAYVASSQDPDLPGDPSLRAELETGLESFYQSAHRVLKLFGTLDELSGIRCIQITQVRNNLIEHPEDEQPYSFGFGSTGPRVKPMHRGTPVWNDEGLVPNTAAFVKEIVDTIGSLNSLGRA